MENFEQSYRESVKKVADLIEKEVETNECFHWTSEIQGATRNDLINDVNKELARRDAEWEKEMRNSPGFKEFLNRHINKE